MVPSAAASRRSSPSLILEFLLRCGHQHEMCMEAILMTQRTDSRAWRYLLAGVVLGVLVCTGISVAGAQQLSADVLKRIRVSTFEVVAKKPQDPLQYERPLPFDALPYQARNDAYNSIGTAFSLGGNRYVTAGHVLASGVNSLWGLPALRDAESKVHVIDKVLKFSQERDLVMFSLADAGDVPALPVARDVELDSIVYAVGNALGQGVVIRDGLLTSMTPEPEAGRWKQLRFSAAASPGNSGGPLLDAKGRVIGVVLAKSPSENLNYAVPIGEVLDASESAGEIDRRVKFELPIMARSYTGRWAAQLQLPASPPDFYAQLARSTNQFLQQQLQGLRQQEQASLFPEGRGALQVQHALAINGRMPAALHMGNDGLWGYARGNTRKLTLPDNGYLETFESGNKGNISLFHLHRPDGLAGDLYGSADVLGGLITASGGIRVGMADQSIAVTRLPPAERDTWFTDRWQRRWRAIQWALPMPNARLLVVALPVPDGYAYLQATAPSVATDNAGLQLRALADFIQVDYGATLAQWETFLQRADLIPPSLADARLQRDASGLTVRMGPVAFTLAPAAEAVGPESELAVGMKFVGTAQGVRLMPNAVRVRSSGNGPSTEFGVWRASAPNAGAEDAWRKRWSALQSQLSPYDGKPYQDRGYTLLRRIAVGGAPAAQALYEVRYARQGSQERPLMQTALDQALGQLRLDGATARVPVPTGVGADGGQAGLPDEDADGQH
jgi:serine protease Do